MPVGETQAGKSVARWTSHALNMGSLGVTGTRRPTPLCATADVILAVGTRLQDFTTGSWALFTGPGRAHRRAQHRSSSTPRKHRAAAAGRRRPGRARGARRGARRLEGARRLDATRASAGKQPNGPTTAAAYTAPTNAELPSDAQVIGAVQRAPRPTDIVRLRRRRPAGRTAQAVAGRRAGRLPHGIRLFLHGLRDRRRPRRQDGAARTATSS